VFFFVFIFRNLLWGSVNYGQSLHGLHNTKSLRTPDLVNKAVYNFLKSVEKQQLEIKHAQLKKQTNTEHGEVNLQIKRTCLCTQRSGSNFIKEI